ncbi:MAG: 1-deoxy-D-xylulose-5-phosphate synthase [Treponema sp.]|jgi:1-deoxy-D-xylulose-5-phosphate synthase|nr:1-deoxy-D-xylulose-5-phosphate synthase [Treponema sp.]
MEDTPLLSHIGGPRDLVRLDYSALTELAAEIRKVIIATVSQNGGHLASNLGVVELTIALHRIFHSPHDKIVWDVGHQCYTHKLLTGRYTGGALFSQLRRMGGLAGFPKYSESAHDAFNTGHASTSISAALGLLAAARLKGEERRVIAVIGDGALTGGLAYEALSHAGQLGLPLIVILNDNTMSISKNVGGLSKYLSRLSMKSKYQNFRRGFDALVKKIPVIGKTLYNIIYRLKRAVKAIFYTDNFFVDLGFEYVGPINGHDVAQLESLLSDIRKLDHPVVAHVITQKGKGYKYAEANPSAYHGVSAFSVDEGLAEPNTGRSFTNAFGEAIVEAAARDGAVTAITAAMEHGAGLAPFKERFPERLFDVGIAEAHAVTFAAGLAYQGLRPVVAVYSTFAQRAYDAVIHDVSLQKLPVVFCLDRAGFVGGDGETHQGLFDIAFFRMAPNMTILAPASGSELKSMLDFALSSRNAVMIRYPKAGCPEECDGFAAPLENGRGVFIRMNNNTPICIAFTGSLYTQTLDAAERLASWGITADIYNLRFLKPVDEDYLAGLMNAYKLIVFAEEGVRAGGFCEYAASLAIKRRCHGHVATLSVDEQLDSLGSRNELLRISGLDGEGIAAFVIAAITKSDVGLNKPSKYDPN